MIVKIGTQANPSKSTWISCGLWTCFSLKLWKWFRSMKWLVFFIRPYIWLVWVQWGSMTKHKDTCSKVIGLCLCLFITTLHIVVNKIGRTYISNQEINKHALLINYNQNPGRSDFQFGLFAEWFIIDLLMQHKFFLV